MIYADILKSIAANSVVDLTGTHEVSGLLVCDCCNTPRQVVIDVCGETIKAPCLCSCQEAAKNQVQADEDTARIEHERARVIHTDKNRGYTFNRDDGKTPDVTNKCKRYVDAFDDIRGQGLMFWGGVGTGKTYFAMCIANALIDRGLSVRVTSLADVVRIAQDFDRAAERLDDLLRADLIVIDDFGTERGTSFAAEAIYNFVDTATTKNIPLIVTTNLTPSAIKAAADDTTNITYARVCSRILERCYPIKVNQVQRREANREANAAYMKGVIDGGSIV